MILELNREHAAPMQRLTLLAFLVAAAPAMPLMAQGLDEEGAIETIIDAPVAIEEKTVDEEEARIAAAIDKSSDNAAEIRKRFAIEQVEIVFVPDLSGQTSALDQKIKDNDEAIKEVPQHAGTRDLRKLLNRQDEDKEKKP